jgi:hypothetical protein
MEKLELINSLRKKIGHYLNPKLKSFKICQTDKEVFIELQTNIKAPLIKKRIHYCNLFVINDLGNDPFDNTINLDKEITDNATTLLGMKIFQLLPDFPEVFKPRERKNIIKNKISQIEIHYLV